MKSKVYYDDSCYVCSLEISMIRSRAEKCGIEFIDISDPSFSLCGDYETEMIGDFDGEQTVGADTFRKMYEKMGFRKMVAFSRLPIVKQAFNLSYWIFAHCVRPFLPRRKR